VGSGGPLAAVPALRKNPPYDVRKDFTPITDIGRYTVFLFVNAEVPAKTFAEFVAHVKANPGKLAYGTGNPSGIVAWAQLNSLVGLDMLHVPYKSAPQVMPDLLSNRVQALMDPPTVALAHVKAGKLRALATTGAKRDPALPDLPTIAEAGVAGYEAGVWFGLAAPAGTPPDVVAKIAAEAIKGTQSPDFVKRMTELGYVIMGEGPDRMAEMLKAEVARWGPIVKASGATAN
jgi:tripartite-type tricarboxylate transporter receptor subunit TctC